MFPWKIIIDDGFSAYEYTLENADENKSIHDCYEAVRKLLGADEAEGRCIKGPAQPQETSN